MIEKELGRFAVISLKNIDTARDIIQIARDMIEMYVEDLVTYRDDLKTYFEKVLNIEILDVEINRFDETHISILLIVSPNKLLEVKDLNDKLQEHLINNFESELPIYIVVRW